MINLINILGKGRSPLFYMIFLISVCRSEAQKSPFQFRIGYEQLFVSPNTTAGLAEKTWTWTDASGDDLISFRTSRTHAYNIGMSYDVTKWWSIDLNFKKFYRRYYIWNGTYLNLEKAESVNGVAGRFEIIPYVYGPFGLPSMLLGSTLATTSWQLGTDFHHKISKNGNWQLHYYLSLNRDLYEVTLHQFDTPVYLEGLGWYNDIYTNQRIDHTTKGDLILNANNPNESQFRASTNIALAISKKLGNGTGLRLEFGLRNIRWIKDNLLDENHWAIDLNHQRSFLDQNDPSIRHIYYDVDVQHNFPLYLGGYYTNLSFTFRPFRSPRDKDDYKSPGKKLGNFLRKIF